MTSSELKDLVKSHFNLVEADVMEETKETFGELKDINGAFTLRFPGDSLQVGDKVTVVTAEGQEMDAPDGEHELEDGTKIRTEGSVVTEIISADGEKALAEEEEEKMESDDKKEEMASDEEEEMAEDEEKMEEEKEEVKMEVEDIVKAIVEEIKEEMKKIEEKMAALEDKVTKMEDAPAAEPTLTSTGKKVENTSKFSKFNVLEAKNADRIQMALKAIKNKK